VEVEPEGRATGLVRVDDSRRPPELAERAVLVRLRPGLVSDADDPTSEIFSAREALTQ
jgi:hypothetical protein